MTKKRISIFAAVALMFTVFAAVLVGCGDNNAKIEVENNMIKTEYYVGDELEFTGGMLSYINNGETTYVKLTKEMVSGFSTANVGSFTMTITYKGKTTTVNYKVSNNEINLSKVYYCHTETSNCWVKFDEATTTLFVYVTSTGTDTQVRWENAVSGTYTTAMENNKQVINASISQGNETIQVKLTPINSTSFTMSGNSLSYTMTAIN